MRTRKGRKVCAKMPEYGICWTLTSEQYDRINKYLSDETNREELCNNNAIKSLETFTLADKEKLSQEIKDLTKSEAMLDLMIRNTGRRC